MKFEKLLKSKINSASFCVVGNAPSEIGRHNGPNIDRFETVIRFNDYSLKFRQDYGKKVNIWVRATNDEVIETLWQKNTVDFDLIVFRTESELNQESISFLKEREQTYGVLPSQYESQLSQKLHAPPSTGLLFLYVLQQNGFLLTRRNVYGFSFFNQEDILRHGNHHYFNIKSRKESPGIATATHNWKKESLFFKTEILD